MNDNAKIVPRVLAVDDRPENLVSLEALLSDIEFDFDQAGSGEEALKMCMRNEYAVILLDVQMPGMDGFETATFLRSSSRTKHTPIIFVTAISNEQKYAFRGYEAGAVDYIAKPINPVILSSKVNVFCGLFCRGKELARVAAHKAQLESQLQAEREIANAKDRLLANMSHEMRTPLNGVVGLGELLLDTPGLSDVQRNYIELINKGGAQLLRLVNQILLINQIESGDLRPQARPFAPRNAFDDVIQEYKDKAAEKGLDLSVSFDEALPDKLVGDSKMIHQVLGYLLDNAVKFTANGSVVVEFGIERLENNDKVKLLLTVKDTGIGIPENKIEHVFDKFMQVDDSTTKQFGGAGLGLSVCKLLLDVLGGEISLKSVEGQGTCACICLELERSR